MTFTSTNYHQIEATSVQQPPPLSQPLPNPTLLACAEGAFKLQRFVLLDGMRQGVELLVIDTEGVRVAICPTRGMSIWKAYIGGVDLGWNSPVEGPIHPSFVPVDEPRGIGWLDGFDELFVRCGLRSFGAPDYDGSGRVQWPVHGRIGNLPAQNLQLFVDTQHSILHVQAEVCETRFLQYNLKLNVHYMFIFGEPAIGVNDTVTNIGGTPTSMQLLYHINVGTPVLGRGAKMHIGAKRVVARDARAVEDLQTWDEYLGPTSGYAEQVYFSESVPCSDGWAKAMLSSADQSRGFAVHYMPSTLPYFSQWKNTVAEADGYVTGLEPATGFPNTRTFEESQGRTVPLAAGESRKFMMRLEGIYDPDRVLQLESELNGLRGGKPAELQELDPQWCMPR